MERKILLQPVTEQIQYNIIRYEEENPRHGHYRFTVGKQATAEHSSNDNQERNNKGHHHGTHTRSLCEGQNHRFTDTKPTDILHVVHIHHFLLLFGNMAMGRYAALRTGSALSNPHLHTISGNTRYRALVNNLMPHETPFVFVSRLLCRVYIAKIQNCFLLANKKHAKYFVVRTK